MSSCKHEKTEIAEPHLAGARRCLLCGAKKFMASGPWYKLVPKIKFFIPIKITKEWKETK